MNEDASYFQAVTLPHLEAVCEKLHMGAKSSLCLYVLYGHEGYSLLLPFLTLFGIDDV
jgi:hypothetical protein